MSTAPTKESFFNDCIRFFESAKIDYVCTIEQGTGQKLLKVLPMTQEQCGLYDKFLEQRVKTQGYL